MGNIVGKSEKKTSLNKKKIATRFTVVISASEFRPVSASCSSAQNTKVSKKTTDHLVASSGLEDKDGKKSDQIAIYLDVQYCSKMNVTEEKLVKVLLFNGTQDDDF